MFLPERTAILAMLVATSGYENLSRQSVLTRVFESMYQRDDMLGFIDLSVIDDHGAHVACAGPFRLRGLNYFKEPWFAEAMTKGRHISDVYMGFRHIPHFIIAVRGYEGEHQWILRATIDLLANHARINAIQIHRHYHPQLPIIASDQSKLQQVFLNLIDNAIDAIGANGEIDVTTELANGNIAIYIDLY